MKYLKVSRCFFLKFWRNVLRTSSKRSKKMSVGWRPWDVNFESLVQMHFHCIIFNFISPNVCLKHKSVSCFIDLSFWRNVLNMSYKGAKMTSDRWRPRNVPRTSILNTSTKGISVVIFSVLVYQMCVLNNKTLVIA